MPRNPRKKPALSEILNYISGLERLGVRPGLSRIKKLLGLLGNPHRRFPSIHVAGTNGKGSTSAFIASMLNEAGYKTGLYTSPHLVRFNERMRIGRKDIPSSAIVDIGLQVKKAAESRTISTPTFFEFTTAMAFLYFAEANTDIAVIEAGMGGRLDATNALARPLVSVITEIGFDHMEYLGDAIEAIAHEKAGIIKKHGLVVTSEGATTAGGVIRKKAAEKDAPLLALGMDFMPENTDAKRLKFDYAGPNHWTLKNLRLGLFGAHQFKNASAALATIHCLKNLGWRITEENIRAGLKGVRWPGRFEIIGRAPLVILDSAHNPHGARALKSALDEIKHKRLILVLGIMADKDIDGILANIAPVAHTVIAASPRTKRAADTTLLIEKLKAYNAKTISAKDIPSAIRCARNIAGPRDAICVTGSIFTVGEARKFLSPH